MMRNRDQTAQQLDEQLSRYLGEAHAIEQQALIQMRQAVEIAGEPSLQAAFRDHLAETEGHERQVDERLRARGGRTSAAQELVMRAGGLGFIGFAQVQPDTPGKLTAHAYSYEHLELAGYEMLQRVAALAGDGETVSMARRIADEERLMAERLEAALDAASESSLSGDLEAALLSYLADAHALEAQSTALLTTAEEDTDDAELKAVYRDHLAQTRGHTEAVEAALSRRGGGPSTLKDAAMRLGAVNWGMFFKAQPDTSAKLVAFAYAFEHLELAGYELLRRVALRVSDEQTAAMAARIVAEERAAAERLAAGFDRAVQVGLVEATS